MRSLSQGLSPKGTVPQSKGTGPAGASPTLRRSQKGYLLITVVVSLFLLATVAVLLTHDSAISANTSSAELETARVEYVAQAGMQHALWRVQNNACMGEITIPETPLGADSYSATITGAAAGTLYKLTADQDAWIRNDDVTRNNGTTVSNHIKQQSGKVEQVLTRFDVSTLPAKARINSATAWFHLKALKVHTEGPINVHEITADWAETDVTWESFAGNYAAERIAMLPAQDAGDVWVAINLTGLVQAWVNGQPNYGILFDTQAEGIHTEYMAREDGTNPPRLEVVVGSGDASPLTIRATGKLVNGIQRKLKDKVAIAYQPPATATLQLGTDPGADAMLDSFYPRNYGAQDFVQVIEDTGNWVQRPVFKFDLGRIPAQSAVLSAQLELRLRNLKTPGTATIHRVARSWVEGTKSGTGTADGATWATYDGTNNWTTAGGDFDAAAVAEATIAATDTWVSWEIGPLVGQWLAGEPNNGLLLKSDGILEEAEFYSKEEADATLRPRLTITYACECGSPCISQTGSGNIMMVVRDATNMWFYDTQKKAILESWGYTVNVIDDDATVAEYDAALTANDVAYISEPTQEASISTKLSNAPIGVVSDEGRLNDELGLADNFLTPVHGTAINVSDDSHYITQMFPVGPVDIYTDTMEGLTVDGNVSPDLQALADWGGKTSLAVLEAGAQAVSGGTVAGRRVMLPFGRQIDSNVNWDRLNSNGRLVVQRSIAWAIGASDGSAGKLLMVVADASSPLTSETDRKSLIESWGYEVTLISDHALQPEFDAALANVDVVYIAGSGSSTAVGTKLTGATVGVLSEDIGLVDELGIADAAFLKRNSQSIEIFDNTHYVTSGFSLGTLQLYSYVPGIWTVTGLYAPGLQILAGTESSGSSYPPGLAFLEAGAELYGGGFAAGRRVQVPWSEGSFNINALNADGQTIMKRAIEWGAGAGCGARKPLLLVVSSAASPTAYETARKALIESWCYNVTLIDDSDSQTNFNAAMTAADVVYVSASVSGPTLQDKATNTDKPIVNEKGSKLGNFGFSSVESGTINASALSSTDATHYITESFAGSAVDVFNSSMSMAVPTGTLAPDLQTIGDVSGSPALVAVETGGTLWDGGSAASRRVHLPFGSASVDQLSTDAKTLMQRAIEWASLTPPPTFKVLLIVGNATTLASKDLGYKALMESWGHTVSIIDDGASQANYDTAMAAADVVYASGSAVGSSMLDKATYTTKGLVNEVNGKIDNFGFSSSTSATANFDNFSATDSSHYITEPFAGDPVTVFTSSLTNPVPGGTLAPDLQNVGDVTGTPSLVTLDAGATRYDSTPSQGRRAHLPFTSAETTDMTADGKTILQRAIEWAVGGGGGEGGGGDGGGGCNGPFTDSFDLVDYGGGSTNWKTEWQETGETTSPSSGDIRIASDASNYRLLVRDDGQTVWREVDLSAATSATVNFDYRRQNLSGSNDYVAVEVSYDGGSNWSELDRFIGTATDSSYLPYSKALDSNSLSANTRIRFRTPNFGMSNSNMVWFDNIEIACTP